MKKIILSLGITLACLSRAFGQEASIVPSGCLYIESGAYDTTDNKIVGGLGVTDARFGFALSSGQYRSKVNITFAYGKVGIGDIYADRVFSDNTFVRLGYFFHRFGLQSTYGPVLKINMFQPVANDAFGYDRQVGAMVVHSVGKALLSADFFTDTSTITTNPQQQRKQGYGAMARAVYAPVNQEGKFMHFGLSGSYEGPSASKSYSFKTLYPTFLGKESAVAMTLDSSEGLVKFTPEVVYGNGKFALEGQFYWANLQREKPLEDFSGLGGYAMLRYMAKGEGYKYSKMDANIATPAPKSIEFVLGASTADLNQKEGFYYAGKHSDLFLNMNYHINKNIVWRTRLSTEKISYPSESNKKDISFFGITTRLVVIL